MILYALLDYVVRIVFDVYYKQQLVVGVFEELSIFERPQNDGTMMHRNTVLNYSLLLLEN
jgi:hypothetical protein